MSTKKIIFTGGGTAGHVTLNLALIPFFQKEGWQIFYIGSKTGIEKDLVNKLDNVKYYSIQTGKLRRYFSFKNFIDTIKIPLGIIQAFFIILKIKPDLIFSKGGFVSVPVVIGGFFNRRTILLHESDITPGLANKLSLPFVSALFTTFPDTEKHIKQKFRSKTQYIGPSVSDRFQKADKEKGLQFLSLSNKKPTLLFVGGSTGAKSLNDAVHQNLDSLLQNFQVVHLCGKGHTNPSIKKDNYKQFEFINKEFPDVLAASDVVISRAGANAIFEFLSIQKPMILVPLSSATSRGEQELNAKSFQENGYCEIIEDKSLSDSKNFVDSINNFYNNRQKYVSNMKNCKMKMTDNDSLFIKIKNFAK